MAITLNLKKGMTLTELLVASILVGIVMMGVASFSVSIRQLQGSANKSTLLAMRTTTAMHRIKSDAMLAVGDSQDCGIKNNTLPNWNLDCGLGVRYYKWTTRQSLCFRHDRANTPETYTDDTWVCHIHGNSYDIHRNDQMDRARVPGSGANPGLGSVTTDLISVEKVGNGEFFNVVENPAGSGRLDYIDIFFTVLYDHDKPYHPINNPRYTLKSRIRPPGHSN